MISSKFTDDEWLPLTNALNLYKSRTKDQSTPMPLIVNMLPLGTVQYSKTLCQQCLKTRMINKDDNQNNIQKPVACSRCHIIINPTQDLLANQHTFVSIMKPINRYTLLRLSEKWFNQDLGENIATFGKIEGDAKYGVYLIYLLVKIRYDKR